MKKHLWKIMLVIAFFLVLGLVAGYFALLYSTYEYTQVVKTYENEGMSSGHYVEYADGVLEYGKDGVVLLTKEGAEVWNQACQIKSPIAEICKNSAAVADRGGTSIYVFQKSGLKGEIQTTKPIEKITVSAQGIVAAILQDEETPMVMCYDAKGNVLVEHKASLTNTGYPVDLALSQDGNVLLVSYLCTKGNGIATKIAFYNFGDAGEDKDDHLVAQSEYADAIAPTVAFLDKDTSMIISDQELIFYEGLDEPKQSAVVELDKEIKSVAYNEKYVALLLKGSGSSQYELCLYRPDGKQVMSAEVDGEYTDMKVSKGQVLLYSGNKCLIYNSAGVCKFQGNLDMTITDIFPVTGISKYMVIDADGFEKIRLIR